MTLKINEVICLDNKRFNCWVLLEYGPDLNISLKEIPPEAAPYEKELSKIAEENKWNYFLNTVKNGKSYWD